MSIVAERMKKIIQTLNIKSVDMATALGLTKGAMSDITTGRVKGFSGSVVELLRLKFNINPEWLQNGDGEMFLPGQFHAEPGTEMSEDFVRIPILGSIAAGKAIESWSHEGDYLTFPRKIFDTRYDILAIRLASVHLDPNEIDLKIGDVCFFERCPIKACEPGNVVVSQVNGHIVTGIFNATPDHIMLMPKDDRFPAYKIAWEDQENVLGRMIAIFRKKV